MAAQAYVAVDNQEHLDPEAFSKFLQHDVHRVRAPSTSSAQRAVSPAGLGASLGAVFTQVGRNLV